MVDRIIDILMQVESVGKLEVNIGIVVIQSNGLFKRLDRLLSLVTLVVDIAKANKCLHVVGVEFDCLIEVLLCLLMVVGLMQ